MLELMKKYYEQDQEIRQAYDTAAEQNDEAGKISAREAHHQWSDKIISEGEDFWKVYQLFESAQERGNEYIDLRDNIWDKDVPALIDNLRKAGIQKFTFSSTWSNTVEPAWLFLQNGCKLEGMAKINGTSKAIMSEEYERVPAYVQHHLTEWSSEKGRQTP